MISVTTKGGLGNQLFQIASIAALSWDHNGSYGVNPNSACVNQGNPPYVYKNNILSKVHWTPEEWVSTSIFHERECGDFTPLHYNDGMLFDGYFQHLRYFDRYSESVTKLFLNEEVIDKLQDSMSIYDLSRTVSVHVRRGDYLKYPKVYNVIDMKYYNKALKQIDVDNILVFSDDMEWCKNNFKGVTFMEDIKDWVALYMMSLCKYNIMANSSLSWWGSYLNTWEHKVVMAPKIWSLVCDNEGLYTDYMTKI